MTIKNILLDLNKRKNALIKQANEVEDFAKNEDDLEFSTAIFAKLDLINELIELYSK